VKIAIVILNWNGKELLDKFLPDIVRYSPTDYCDIYVADNASTDDSIAFIEQNFSSVKIINNKANYGYAKGYNEALKQVDADILALVNSDIEVTPNWLEPIINSFKQDDNIAIIQPKILDYKQKTKFEYAGAAGGFIDKYGFPFCRGRIFNELEEDTQQYNDVSPIFWASGACFFIRQSVFNELQGFDEDFFAHFEEIDLCWRAQNLNHKIIYNGNSAVYHVGGATLETGNPKKTYLNFRNNLYMLLKNLPLKNLYGKLLLRMILDGIAGIKFILELKPKHTLAIIKAHFSFYANFSKFHSKRGLHTHKKEDYFYTKSIVKLHFLKKIKCFKDI
jgi:GT2 family glycosyltransferase